MKTAKSAVIYFSTGPIPMHFGFTVCEPAFDREMKRLGVEDPPSMMHAGAPGTTHWFEHPKYGIMAIVTLNPKAARSHSKDEVWGLLTHEAVHVYQRAVEAMRDRSPSDEFMAYCIQDWSQKLWLAWEEAKRA